MPVAIGLVIFGIISVTSMPNPDQIVRQYPELSTDKTRPLGQEQSENEEGSEPVSSYVNMIRRNPTLTLFIGTSVLLALGRSSAMVFLIRIIEAVGGNAQNLGTTILIQAGIEFPMLFASAWLLKKFKVSSILVFSFFCFAIRQFGFVLAPSVGAIYGVATINIFCIGIYAFASVIFVHSIVRPSEMVRAQTLIVLSQGVGQILGSSISGVLIDLLGLKPLIIIGGIIILIAACLMVVCRQRHISHFIQER
jgi:PPP family 3-phenylpropionic acid transporter